MTNERAIEIFKEIKAECEAKQTELSKQVFIHEGIEALDVAIKVLEREPILEKIRAEIVEEKEYAYADFKRYKVEYLGQDWEDAYDSLPQDDFRYGMERCIDIIDKYKAESEDEE